MTKNKFVEILKEQLIKRGISDYEDIAEEYEQHFTFKLKLGYTEEEISAKLGDPTDIAKQFVGVEASASGRRKIPTFIGLGVLDFFAFIFYTVLVTFGIAIATFCVSSTAISVCLLGEFNLHNLIPPMPYWCAVPAGVAFLLLAVMTAAALIYYVLLIIQLYRSYKRFHSNAVASVTARAVLPPVSATPQLEPKTYRCFRKTLMITLFLFIFFFVASFVVSIVSAGGFEFWHIWGWFGYGN